jgi:sulfur relay (sulfurtransferase) complex TusBCD TusD component (DsrE family)
MYLGKLLIILFSSPFQYQNTDTFCEFAKAAVEGGHEVSVFCDIDAVYNLVASQILLEKMTPAKKFAKLIEKGVRVLVCQQSARFRGVDVEKALVKGVIRSSLGELAQLMEGSDRVVSFNI